MTDASVRRRSGWAGLLAAVALLAGCQVVGDDGGGGGDGPATDPSPWPSATMPTEVPSWLLECGEDKDGERDPSLRLTTLDLTQATWTMPDGFQPASGYSEENPVETMFSEWIAEPTSPALPSLNVINVVIYTGVDWGDLADGCGRVPLSAVEEKLARYREVIDAEPLAEAEMVEVAGLPAIQQDIGLASYDYTGYWLFTETQLLHVYCQWTGASEEPVIRGGCDDLVGSVQVPGA